MTGAAVEGADRTGGAAGAFGLRALGLLAFGLRAPGLPSFGLRSLSLAAFGLRGAGAVVGSAPSG